MEESFESGPDDAREEVRGGSGDTFYADFVGSGICDIPCETVSNGMSGRSLERDFVIREGDLRGVGGILASAGRGEGIGNI